MKRRSAAAVVVISSLTLGACHKKPVPIAPVPVTASTAPATDDQAAARVREQFVRDSLARAQADAAARMAAQRVRLRAVLEAPAYFDYDASDITAASRTSLDNKLPVLRTNMSVRIRISGHTDSRGSDEYNLALGLRRAAATRKYLSDRGIGADRIEIVSFGEERPAASGDSEAAYTQNRRAEFEILSGADALQEPPR